MGVPRGRQQSTCQESLNHHGIEVAGPGAEIGEVKVSALACGDNVRRCARLLHIRNCDGLLHIEGSGDLAYRYECFRCSAMAEITVSNSDSELFSSEL